ncbi:MAG: hypothetical protein Ta2F_01790 [Termitinemataceae bacterium]|nr:MAG: hypothetical protein Ta2F_01790 [Termitinemataceae bacterium]
MYPCWNLVQVKKTTKKLITTVEVKIADENVTWMFQEIDDCKMVLSVREIYFSITLLVNYEFARF